MDRVGRIKSLLDRQRRFGYRNRGSEDEGEISNLENTGPLAQLINVLEQNDMTPIINDLDLIYDRSQFIRFYSESSNSFFSFPPVVSNFLGNYFESKKSNHFLVLGDLPIAAKLAASSNGNTVELLTRNTEHKILEKFGIEGLKTHSMDSSLDVFNSEHHRGNLEFRPPPRYIDQISNFVRKDYDAILHFGPLREGRFRLTHQMGDVSQILHGDAYSHQLLNMSARLAENGVLIFVLPIGHIVVNNQHSLLNVIRENGMHVSGLFRFRTGRNDSQPYLVIADKNQRGKIFVGEIPSDDTLSTFVERFVQKKDSPLARQGRLIEPDRFFGLANLEAYERYTKKSRELKMTSYSFGDVIHTIQHSPSSLDSEFFGFEENPNAIYFNRNNRYPKFIVSMQQSDFISQSNDISGIAYTQLILNPDVVIPEFFVEWWKSELGLLFRTASSIDSTGLSRTGPFRPTIAQHRRIVLPGLEEQRTFLDVSWKIDTVSQQIDYMKEELWSNPGSAEDILESNALLTTDHDPVEHWTDSLPYPLAAILRSYFTVDNDSLSKYTRLFSFFEAFAQFVAGIHWSAFKQDEIIWNEQKEQIATTLQKNNISFRTPTFALWNIINENLSKRLLGMLEQADKNEEDDESFDLIRKMYKTEDFRLLKSLASTEMRTLLQNVNSMRNQNTPAHAGMGSEKVASDRLRKIEEYLHNLQNILRYRFKNYRLLQAGKIEVVQGTFITDVKVVMGSNPLLNSEQIELSSTIDTGTLCFFDSNQTEALQLIPLIQLSEDPQPSGYFFNGFNQNSATLVAYHNVDDSEKIMENQIFREVFNDFEIE